MDTTGTDGLRLHRRTNNAHPWSDFALNLSRMTHAMFLSDTIHCPMVTSKSVFRTTVLNRRSMLCSGIVNRIHEPRFVNSLLSKWWFLRTKSFISSFYFHLFDLFFSCFETDSPFKTWNPYPRLIGPVVLSTGDQLLLLSNTIATG